MTFTTETMDGMRIDWDVPIEMNDGLVVRADVFRPIEDGRYPVILSYGPYAKGLSFQEGYPDQWKRMVSQHPDVAEGSSNRYQSWEVVDPEKWVPAGYACVRVDSRGTGRSPGYVDHFSPRETQDFYDCIEWAAVQPWSSGKVGLNGISYYGINQWHVASLQPPHLSALCVWEGAADWYRDMTHHGGILSTFWANWYDMQVKTVQYGLGDRGPKSPVTGANACGDENLSDEQLAANRQDFGAEILSHPLDDEYHRDRSPQWDRITVPLLTAANWGGHGLHARGNFEGFTRSATNQKWLEAHGIEHWTHFYTDYGRELQQRFFDHFLKGEANGWDQHPRVQLQVRHPDEHFELRCEEDWPVPRTRWTKFYLYPDLTLHRQPTLEAAELQFEALGDGLRFTSEPLTETTEFTGPAAAKLWISSSTED
ncbi:MAG TPA: CocE/NonD family hydrolase, partial [Acidimicrobiia bacterium]|nr:CocE/NonD family hydrolase [Acidimicrobiia bacterium]